MRVICTAGHVDHGKSTLVQALSGINPDRLREEIERQLTIDLGFAWITLPNDELLGIVDVPGHEDFIENMLAGVGGLDMVLMIVAADEGVMPQTREHLAIVELMGMTNGIVALTKTDAAESEDWIELVELDVMELLSDGPLADSPIVRVSAHTGDGLNELIEVLTEQLASAPQRRDIGQPVLPIDRVFTMSGFGTVVTGTLSDGALEVGQTVEIQPGGIEARVRGLQTHNESLDIAQPGSRVAVNLSGIDKSDVQRGDVLSLPGSIHPTLLFDATLRLLPDAARPLKHNAEVKVFVGPSESLARVRLLDADSLSPGAEGYVQLMLQEELPIRNGQRFVLRIPSPSETIGGGVVLDTAPGRKWKRNREDVIERFEVLTQDDPALKLAYELRLARAPQPVNQIDPDILAEAVEAHGLIEIEGHIAHPDAIESLATRAESILTDFHAENPLLPGIDPAELLRQLRVEESESITLAALNKIGVIESGRTVNLPGQGMRFSKAQQKAVESLLIDFDRSPYAPPSYKDASKAVGEGVVKALLAQGELVFFRPDVLMRPDAYRAMIDYTREKLEAGEAVSVASLRDHFETSRRIALPFLDMLEGQGITKRADDGHTLHKDRWDAL